MRKRLLKLRMGSRSRARLVWTGLGAVFLGAGLALILCRKPEWTFCGWMLSVLSLLLVGGCVLAAFRDALRLRRARAAVGRDPTNPARHYEWAVAANGQGDAEGALRAFRNAIHLDLGLDIGDHPRTSRAMRQHYARSRREAEWIDDMARFASLEHAIEHAEQATLGRDEGRRPATRADRLQCLATIESVKMELSGLELFRNALGDFVQGYEYYESSQTLEEEIRLLQEHLDELEEILRELEDA